MACSSLRELFLTSKRLLTLHRPIVEGCVEALNGIFFEDRYADKVITYYLKKNKKWGSRDRRFFSETIYDVVRWKRKLCVAALCKEKPETERDLWWILAALWATKALELPKYSEWKGFQASLFLDSWHDEKHSFAVQQSYPDDLVKLFEAELPECWKDVLVRLNEKAPIFLRCNELRCDRKNLKKTLQKEGVVTELVSAHEKYRDGAVGLKLTERKNVFVTQAFKNGFFEMQDGASQLVAPFSEVKSGEKVIDACAGAGGKSLHLAAQMKNKGKIIAMDIHLWKLKELKLRARRNKVDIIETRVLENSKVVKRLKGKADCLLLDVPCTGLGVLRRNPDTKWKIDRDRVDELVALQEQILKDYSLMVKPGGRLIYATCSVLPRENRQQVDRFLANTDESWEFIEDQTVLPGEGGFDGFYMAKLKKGP